MTDSAVAVREERHPIIAQIDEKMPEIAGMLPDGMRPERFRKVVVQALLRNPDLWNCTPISVVTAITEAAEVGIEPTGVLGKGWLLPYNKNTAPKGQPDHWIKEAKFIPGWRGLVDLCWRADRLLLTPELVREGDHFEYRRGTGQYLHHVPVLDDPDREQSTDNITFAYVVVRFPDGREDFEVMSRRDIERIRDRARKKNPVWDSDFGEMAKKTPVRRIAKRLPLSPAVQRMLARDEETDFDTPVERVADPKRAALHDRIAERTAAIRGEPTESGEPEGSEPLAGNRAESEIARHAAGADPEEGARKTSSGGSPSTRSGDPWMRRLHAMAAERGMDHDALHDWVVEHFHVESLSDLTPPQRATFMELVERMEVMPTSAPVADAGAEEARASAPDSDPPSDEASTAKAGGPVADTVPPGGQDVPPVASDPAASAPSLDEILAVTGGELVPPKPGTPEYRALPNGTERAQAKAYWDGRKAAPEQETLADAFGAPKSD